MLSTLYYFIANVVYYGKLDCWMVFSGGSRISPRRGRQLSRGAPTYDFAKFFQKLHEIERIWTPRGERVSKILLCRSATGFNQSHQLTKFSELLEQNLLHKSAALFLTAQCRNHKVKFFLQNKKEFQSNGNRRLADRCKRYIVNKFGNVWAWWGQQRLV